MSDTITIRLPFGRKSKIDLDTFRAIKRAIHIFDDDRRVIAYATAPHEQIGTEVAQHIRRRMIARGELPARSYSRRKEFAVDISANTHANIDRQIEHKRA